MLVPTEQVANLENLETGRGRVVGPVPVGHFGEARVKQANDPPRDRGEQFCAIETGLEVLKPTITSAELAQVGSGGDAEHPSGEQDGSVREAMSGPVLEIPDAQVDGNGSIGGHKAGYWGPRREAPVFGRDGLEHVAWAVPHQGQTRRVSPEGVAVVRPGRA